MGKDNARSRPPNPDWWAQFVKYLNHLLVHRTKRVDMNCERVLGTILALVTVVCFQGLDLSQK